MTFSWSPAVKEPLESDIWAEKFDDFMINWVVTGLTPTNGGSGILDIASGTCWIDGWRVETTGENYDMSGKGNDDYYVYIELTKDGLGKIVSVSTTDYTTPQTEDIRILIAIVTIDTALITFIDDERQYDPFETTLVRLMKDVSLSAWQHASDLSKIDGAEIYDGSIMNAEINATANILSSKILLDGTTQLDSWQKTGDLTKIDGAKISDETITATQILNGTILNAEINASAAIDYSKLNLTGDIINADINTGAAIAYSKLNLTASIISGDIATSGIVSSKILISGTTFLSAWRHATDLTKIDGADIYTASITKTQLGADCVEASELANSAVSNIHVNAGAAIAMSKLSLSIMNAQVNASAAIAWTKISKVGSNINHLESHSHGDLTGLGDHDHGIYPREASTETISAEWTFTGGMVVNADLDIKGGPANKLSIYHGTTKVGSIYGIYSDTFIIEGLDTGYTLVTGKYVGIASSVVGGHILFETEGSIDALMIVKDLITSYHDIVMDGGADIMCNSSGSDIGDSGNKFDDIWCVLVHEGSEHREPLNAFETLTLLKPMMKSGMEDGRIDVAKDIPDQLRGWDSKKNRYHTSGRSLGDTINYLIFAMGDIQEKFNVYEERIATLELAIAMLNPI